MKRETTQMPAYLRDEIRRFRNMANATARAFVANNIEEYNAFVKKLETPKSADESGLHDFWLVMGKCIPEEVRDVFDESLDRFLESDEAWKNFIPKYIKTDEGKALLENGGIPDDIMKKPTRDAIMHLLGTTIEQCKQEMKAFYYFLDIINGNFNSTYIANLMVAVIDGDDPKATYTYYYIAYDHGLQKIINTISAEWMTEEKRHEMGGFFGLMVPSFVKSTAMMGIIDKTQWTEYAENNEDDNIYKEVYGSLRYVESNKGLRKEFIPLTEMLVNDKDGEILLGIEGFLKENTESVSLAYLLLSLEKAKRIRCKSFGLFLKAINSHFDMNVPYRKAQERYSEIKNEPYCLGSKERKAMARARQIIDEWTNVFRNCA